MFEYTPPANCTKCPFVALCLQQVRDAEKQGQALTDMATDDNLTPLIQETISRVTGAPEPVAEEIATHGLASFRHSVAHNLDAIDAFTDEAKEKLALLTGSCDGPLKMRARTKAGEVITAIFCNSDEADHDTQPEPAIIERSDRP